MHNQEALIQAELDPEGVGAQIAVGSADPNVAELSDGERQKAMVARALAQQTPVLLLDEPMAYLDIPARNGLMHALRRQAAGQGTSVLISTHDLGLARKYADICWVLHPGGIESGSPDTLEQEGVFARLLGA